MANSIKIGSNSFNKAYIGNQRVSKIYVGSTLFYQYQDAPQEPQGFVKYTISGSGFDFCDGLYYKNMDYNFDIFDYVRMFIDPHGYFAYELDGTIGVNIVDTSEPIPTLYTEDFSIMVIHGATIDPNNTTDIIVPTPGKSCCIPLSEEAPSFETFTLIPFNIPTLPIYYKLVQIATNNSNSRTDFKTIEYSRGTFDLLAYTVIIAELSDLIMGKIGFEVDGVYYEGQYLKTKETDSITGETFTYESATLEIGDTAYELVNDLKFNKAGGIVHAPDQSMFVINGTPNFTTINLVPCRT